ncbi:MAG TPA: hypothetical protein VK187_13075, partial [Geobacteraceae bacterium]|nr:hypothetical protein [Geobacteraceae bacterium]
MSTDRGIPLTILLTSSASLAYEVALTRIFSISLWYHFAFMIISIAMLGFAASGAALSLYPALREIGRLQLYALFLGIAIPASYLLANAVPFDPVRLGWERTQFLFIALYYVILAVPFFCAGLVVATAFAAQSSQAGLFYGADLLGAGLGSLGVLVLLGMASPERGVFVISAIALAAVCLTGRLRLRCAALLLIALDCLFLITPPRFAALRISPYKGLPNALQYPGAAPLQTYHAPFARIDTFTSPAVRFAPGLSLRYLAPLPRQIGLAIDGGDLTAITAAGDRKALEFLDFLPAALPYVLGEKRRVLVLDPQGGLQALVAQRSGAERIVKVEGNPSLVRVVRQDWGGFSGNIYERNTFTGLGRSWLQGQREEFDIIDISLQGIEPYGSFGIAEDYRFTLEAFKEYFGHLGTNGILGLNLYIIPPPRSELRLLATMVRALEEQGIREPARHLAAVRSWGSIILVAKRSPLAAAEIETIRRFAAERRFDLLHYPGITAAESGIYIKSRGADYFRAFAAILDPRQQGEFMADYMFDVAPVTDDRPFFTYFLKLNRTGDIYRAMGRKWQFFLEEGYIVPAVFCQVLVLSLGLFLAPAFVRRERTNEEVRGRRFLPYFAFLGIGYMFVETALIQKTILPLEHPSSAVAAVLASLLVSSGMGSLLSQRFKPLRTPAVPVVIALLIIVYGLFVPAVSTLIAPKTLPIKVILVFLELFPLGLFMGIPFPTGLQRIGACA